MKRLRAYMISLAESIKYLLKGMAGLLFDWPSQLRLLIYRLKALRFGGRLTGGTVIAWLFCLLAPVFLSAQEDRLDSGAVQPPDTEDTGVRIYSRDQDPDTRGLTYGGIEGERLLRTVPDSTVERLQQDRDFRYANDPAYWSASKKGDDSWLIWVFALLESPLAKGIMYLLLGALILLILYQALAVNNLFVFSRSSKQKKDKTRAPEEQVADDLDKRIGNAIDNNDLRLAIRYLYLQTLQALGKKDLIKYDSRTTNRDYLLQMRSHPGASAFDSLTQAYEYIWYGEFEPSREQFERIRKNFKQFMHTC